VTFPSSKRIVPAVVLALVLIGAAARLEFLRGTLPIVLLLILLSHGRIYGLRITTKDDSIQLMAQDKIIRYKPVKTGVREVIEWHGYEGDLCDIFWADGDVWTFDCAKDFPAKVLEKTLRDAGLPPFPSRREYRVFRPINSTTRETTLSAASE